MLLIRISAFYLLSSLLSSCQPQTAESHEEASAVKSAAPVTVAAPSLALRFSQTISGYWISDQYWKVAQRTRSPLAAFDHTPPGPSSIYIEPFSEQRDSTEFAISYGLHEGGSRILLLRPGREANSLLLKPEQYSSEKDILHELAYKISATDTTLLLIERNAKTNRISKRIPYRRVLKPGVKTDLEGGVSWGVNQLLVAGQYRGIDSLGQSVAVSFLPDGTVIGLPFREYSIQIDFMGPNAGDELVFATGSKTKLPLAATFGRDTLRFYSIHSILKVGPDESDTTEVFQRGRLRYQLVRIRKP